VVKHSSELYTGEPPSALPNVITVAAVQKHNHT